MRKISNAHIFEAVVSRNATARGFMDDLLRLFGGRSQPVMAQLLESGKLTKKILRKHKRPCGNWPGRRNRNEFARRSSAAIDRARLRGGVVGAGVSE